MSFFDEVEEETRVRPPVGGSRRTPGRGSRRPPRGGGSRSGGGGRPPRGGSRSTAEEQAIRVRRAVAGAALLVVLILIVVGVHSCSVSAANGALRAYNDSVNSLIRASNQNGQEFFSLLAHAGGSTNAANLQSQIDGTRITADHQLSRAEGLSVPGEVKPAQQYLVSTMKLRRDAIANIASQIQPALQASSAAAAVTGIAAEMERLYASDVLYKDYALPMIQTALSNAGIAVGGQNGEPANTQQILPSLQWLSPVYVASALHTSVPAAANAKAAPGIHGHALDSCSVGNSTLDPATTTTLPAGSPPTLSCTVTNDGQNTETNVTVTATIGGTSITGKGGIPQTQPNQQYTVQIPLSGAPPAGTYSLTVTVQHVPGETTFTHNMKVFPVTFG